MITVVTYIRGDADMLDDWFKWYKDLGVDRFHFWTHGAPRENEYLEDVAKDWGAKIIGRHGDTFYEPLSAKGAGIGIMLDTLHGDWVVLADSDELLELPVDGGFPEMIRFLTEGHAGTFSAPQMERIARGGFAAAERDEEVSLHANYPLCAPGLRTYIGKWNGVRKFRWEVDKYIFWRHKPEIKLRGTGYHKAPTNVLPHKRARGVTHHFMWREGSVSKFENAVQRGHNARRGRYSVFLRYLKAHDGILPLTNVFEYSREALIKGRFLSLDGGNVARRIASNGRVVIIDQNVKTVRVVGDTPAQRAAKRRSVWVAERRSGVKLIRVSHTRVIDGRQGGRGTYDPREKGDG